MEYEKNLHKSWPRHSFNDLILPVTPASRSNRIYLKMLVIFLVVVPKFGNNKTIYRKSLALNLFEASHFNWSLTISKHQGLQNPLKK